MGINVLDEKIVKLFNDSPTWFRNCIYVLVVITATFYVLIPNEIGGVVEEVGSGGERSAAGDLMVSAVRGSVRYYVNSTQDGTWRILSPSRLPGAHEIDFRSSHTPLQVLGTITTCYADFLPGATIKVNHTPDGDGTAIVRVDANCEIDAADDVAAARFEMPRLALISSAQAQVVVKELDLRRIDKQLQQIEAAAPAVKPPNPPMPTIPSELQEAGIEQRDLIQASVNPAPREYLGRTLVLKSVADTPSVYLHVGSVNAAGDWEAQKVKRVDELAQGALASGDVIRADVPLNLREDYIRRGFFGWRNAEKVGQAKPGDTFVIKGSKLIGNHLWVEAAAVEIDE